MTYGASNDIMPTMWRKLSKLPVIDVRGVDECWPWIGGSLVRGYGTIRHGGRSVYAHRRMYEVAHGVELSPKELICHKCDNPICVNPAHLFKGSHKDNSVDMIKKGRGAGHFARHTTDEQVRQTRELWATGAYTQKELAGMMGVTPSVVSRLVNRKREFRHR